MLWRMVSARLVEACVLSMSVFDMLGCLRAKVYTYYVPQDMSRQQKPS